MGTDGTCCIVLLSSSFKNAFSGDEAYTLSSTMLVQTRQSQRGRMDPIFREKALAFDRQVRKVRVIIEHTIGMLKQRFPCLLGQLRFRRMRVIHDIIGNGIT